MNYLSQQTKPKPKPKVDS
jgi:hypothetical protein